MEVAKTITKKKQSKVLDELKAKNQTKITKKNVLVQLQTKNKKKDLLAEKASVPDISNTIEDTKTMTKIQRINHTTTRNNKSEGVRNTKYNLTYNDLSAANSKDIITHLSTEITQEMTEISKKTWISKSKSKISSDIHQKR